MFPAIFLNWIGRNGGLNERKYNDYVIPMMITKACVSLGYQYLAINKAKHRTIHCLRKLKYSLYELLI